jgi:ATPase family associated with various cellular activities (AAA)
MTTHFPSIAGGTPVQTVPKFKYMDRLRRPNDPITRQRFEFRDLGMFVRGWLTRQIGVNTRDSAARMAWVQGRAGEGKTEGCLVAALNANFHVLALSGGDFAGKTEGASVETLHAVLAECVWYSALNNVRIVITLDDFDLSTANPGDASHTINSQLLTKEFMALADERHRYRNVDGSNIGFIVTVNDASRMRESLTRSGRADWYDHVPSPEDKANIAFAILDPKTSAQRDLVKALVHKNKCQPVSFWKALYHGMQSEQARNLIKDGMPNAAVIDEAYGKRLRLTAEIAWPVANRLRKSRVQNWLNKKRNWLGR